MQAAARHTESGVHRLKKPNYRKKRVAQTKRTRTPREPGVVSQVRTAFKRRNALATCIGLVFGGAVPVGTYLVSHYEAGFESHHGIVMCLFVLGGLLFSSITVWSWSSAAFRNGWKATGFTLFAEGLMTLTTIPWLAPAVLVLLVAINGIATGVALSRNG